MTATLPKHTVIDPAILYFGTPVVLVSTTNPDGSANLAPFSSAFWLGDRAVLGISLASQTSANLARTGEAVVALPSAAEVAADVVSAPLVAECPVAMECFVEHMAEDGRRAPVVELRVERVHVHPELRLAGHANRIDPDRWRPLIMSFQQFYGLGPRVQPSRLASIDEEQYRG